jgi:hypothetical protein
MSGKKYRIDVEYNIVKTVNISRTIEAESHEEAEKSIMKYVEDGARVISIQSKYIPYKTNNWQDIEDILFSYDDQISESESEGDTEMVECYKADRADWEYILEQLINKEFKKAAERYSNLDTIVREQIPDRLYELFDSLELI